MVCAYFGLVNPSPGLFWLAATVGGGGGGGVPGPPLCAFKTPHDTAHQNCTKYFTHFFQNLGITGLTRCHVILLNLLKKSKFHQFF